MMEKVQAPKSTRYQLIIDLKEREVVELENLVKSGSIEQFKNEEGNEIYLVLRRHLMWFYNEMCKINRDISFVTWAEGEFQIISPDEDDDFPMDPETLSLFFDGILVRKKKGKVYIRFRLIYPGDHEAAQQQHCDDQSLLRSLNYI